MIQNSYTIYESAKAMEDFYNAYQLAPESIVNTHYVSEKTAAANLELAYLYYEAYKNTLESWEE